MMVEYLYRARIWTDTTNVLGVDPSVEAANKIDFEANYKASTVAVTDLEVMGTTFLIEKTYANFKPLIDGTNIKWTDIKCETAAIYYDLYLITTEPI